MEPLVELPCSTQPPAKSCWIATTQKYITSKCSWKEGHCKLVCERRTAKSTVRTRAYCISAFPPFVCIQHGIKKVLQVTKPLNALDEVEDTMHDQLPAWGVQGSL